MYLINPLTASAANELYLQSSRIRTGRRLSGVQNGVNTVFGLPNSESFVYTPPNLTIQIYRNGQRLALLTDFVVSEGWGPGTGFNIITLVIPPTPKEVLLADYYVDT